MEEEIFWWILILVIIHTHLLFHFHFQSSLSLISSYRQIVHTDKNLYYRPDGTKEILSESKFDQLINEN